MKYVVIGSGIIGACAAYYLSQETAHEVILIDEELEGKATSAGAGIICPWISHVKDPNWFTIASRGAQHYPELIESLKEIGETNTGYALTGALATSEKLEDLSTLKEELEELKKQFPVIGNINLLEAEDAKEYFPPLNENIYALHIDGSARLDGRLLAESLVNGIRKNGGKVIKDKADLQKINNRVEVSTSEYTIVPDQVIVSAGAWTKDLLKQVDVQVNIEPQRGQIVHLSVDQDTSKWPVILPEDSDHYIVAFDDNRIAMGATREEGAGFEYRLTAGGVHEVLKEGLRVAPGLENERIKEVRIGFRPMSPDDNPLLGSIPKFDNLIVATGVGKSGLLMGPYVGSLAAKIAMDKAIDIDISPYNPLR